MFGCRGRRRAARKSVKRRWLAAVVPVLAVVTALMVVWTGACGPGVAGREGIPGGHGRSTRAGLPAQAVAALSAALERTRSPARNQGSPQSPQEWVWDERAHLWGLWRWDVTAGLGRWRLVEVREATPPEQAPVEEWVFDRDRGVWGLWRWDFRSVRWTLVRHRREAPPGKAEPGSGVPATPPPGVRDTARSGVVRSRGRSLVVDGRPFRYVGINAYGLNGRETGSPYPLEQVEALFDRLPRGTMIRTWGWANNPPESLGPIIRAAEARGLRLIVTLTEGAGHDDRPLKGRQWYARGFRDDAMPWVDQVVGRYRGSPAIGMWEVMNEPGWQTDGPVDGEAMHTFMTTMARRIKAIDPDHLVGTGAIDCTNAKAWAEGDTCARINADPSIDVMSVHDYADRYEGGALISGNFEAKLRRVAGIAKPIIVGEVGLAGGTDGSCRSLEDRAALYRRKFDAYFARGVSGINVWNVTAEPRGCSGSEQYDIGFDDPVLRLLRSYRAQPG